jgi:hypothetical protein
VLTHFRFRGRSEVYRRDLEPLAVIILGLAIEDDDDPTARVDDA